MLTAQPSQNIKQTGAVNNLGQGLYQLTMEHRNRNPAVNRRLTRYSHKIKRTATGPQLNSFALLEVFNQLLFVKLRHHHDGMAVECCPRLLCND